jgi:hypothetical protein
MAGIFLRYIPYLYDIHKSLNGINANMRSNFPGRGNHKYKSLIWLTNGKNKKRAE